MDAHLRAGIAIYNAGEYHAAHDAWEDHWLSLETGTEDELFLHGLIQFTATIYHARNRNWAGATGLAASAQEYLEQLPDRYREVDIRRVRDVLGSLESDPEIIERRRPVALTYEGRQLDFGDLGFESTCVAAVVLAEETGYDETRIEAAIEFAREAVEQNASNPFVGLLFEFVRSSDRRAIIYQRLTEHTKRRQSRDDDVSGLFDAD